MNIQLDSIRAINVNQHFELSRSKLDIYVLAGVMFYLVTVVFEGPIRQVLSFLNVGTLLYIRDLVVMLVIMATVCAIILNNGTLIGPLFISIYFLLLYLFIGLLISNVTLFAGLFGLKIFSITLLGIALSYYLTSLEPYIYRFTFFFLVVTTLGVFLNFIIGKFPWEGLEFETAFGVATTTREWWTQHGGRRLPGFTRASFDAAMIIGISFAYIINRLSKTRALLFGIICLVAVYLTTSKGMVIALILVLVWYLAPLGRLRITIGRILIISLLLILIALPLFSCITSSSFRDFAELPSILFSFVDRIVNTWPRSCLLLSEPYNWLLGNGVGSIGVPLQYNFAARLFSPADNLFVYIFVTGGIIWSFGLIFTIAKALGPPKSFGQFYDDWNIRIYALIIVILGYGITSNMHEQPFYSVYAGLLIGIVWRSRHAQD